MDNVVDDGAVRVYCAQHHSLYRPPWIGWDMVTDSRRFRRRWNGADSIKDVSKPVQRPLLVQPGRQDPFALSLCLDIQCAALACFLPAVSLLQQLDLLVWMHIETLRGQSRHQRPW